MNRRRVLMAAIFSVTTLAGALTAQENGPTPTVGATTLPATAPATLKLSDLSPEAKKAVDALAGAYAGLKSLQINGTSYGRFNVSGQEKNISQEFASSYAAPALFKYEMKDQLAVGMTGKQLYTYSAESNLYRLADLGATKLPVSGPDVGPTQTSDLTELLRSQNLSLALALSQDPAAQMVAGASDVKVVPAEEIDGKQFDTLAFTFSGADVKVLTDSQTKLIRRVVADVRRTLLDRGATDVKLATITTDYTAMTPNVELAQASFDWTPPAGARDAGKNEGMTDIEALEAELVGKPAADFTLKDLKGADVKLADLKGSYVVLDFWATWCPPCVATLPHMDKLAKELGPGGLKAFSVNLDEDKPTVEAFMKEKSLTIPVLLDAGSKVAEKYHGENPPMKIVIGPDGTIKAAFLGTSPEKEERFEKTLKQILAGG